MTVDQQAQPEPPHIPALDGIRAVAVLFVVLVHCDLFLYNGFVTEGERSLPALRYISGIGWTGVDLFFVLSGMLITGILLDSKGGEGYFRSFYMRRTLRIFPLYYAALIVITLVLPAIVGNAAHDSMQARTGTWSLWVYLTNIPVARAEAWGVVPPLTGHFWSLAVEEQFYLIWPVLVWWLSIARLRIVAIALIAGAMMLRLVLTHLGDHALGTLLLLPTRIDTLAIGALIAITARTRAGLTPLRRWTPMVGALCVAGFLLIDRLDRGASNLAPRMQRYGFALVAVGYAALLIHALTSDPTSRLTRFFSRPSLRWIGGRSYAIYVWHPLVIRALAFAQVPQRAPLAQIPLPLRQFVLFATTVAISAALAECSWRLIEAPCLSLKRYFPRPQHVQPRVPAPY